MPRLRACNMDDLSHSASVDWLVGSHFFFFGSFVLVFGLVDAVFCFVFSIPCGCIK